MKREVKVGERFGRLVINEEPFVKKRKKIVSAICDCGTIKQYGFYKIQTGHTKSCGCLTRTVLGMSKTRIYNILVGMKTRCYNKNHKTYSHYGGRGITVCDEWLRENGFINFYNWSMDNGYSDDLTIDRIDNNKGYSPDNCRWSDAITQSVNRGFQKNNTTGYKGITFCKTQKKWRPSAGCKNLKRCKTLKEAVEVRNKYILENNLPYKIQEYKE